jgi:hypothetical protein
VGAKFTAVLALPAIALVVGAGRPLQDWPRLALAGVVGLGLGSTWYIVNLVETGDLDGGLGHAAEQRAELALEPVATTAVRLGLDVIDMSGAPAPYERLFAGTAGLVILVALLSGGPRSRRVALAAASIPIAGVMLLPAVFELAERVVVKAWLVLGAQSGPEFERWDMNVEADATLSWYGPLGALLLPAGAVGVVVLWLRRSSPALGPRLRPGASGSGTRWSPPRSRASQ